MKSPKSIFQLSKVFPDFNIEYHLRINLYRLFFFSVLMACLEFGQDYISATLNDTYFSTVQSLSYKLFWLLFVPFSIGLIYWFKKVQGYLSKKLYVALSVFLIMLVTLTHLVLFSIMLYSISDISGSLYFLLTEKLSTRLYIALSVYGIFSMYYYRYNQRENERSLQRPNPLKSIAVKNGTNTILVAINTINWISSDGAYLSIHTDNKEHVIIDSLKNIITLLPENFKRIHRSTIVNIDQIKKLKSRGNGDYDITMEEGTVLRLSRNYTEPLRGRLL